MHICVTVHLLHAELFPQHFFFKYSSRFSTSVTQHRGYPPARFRGWGLFSMTHLLPTYIPKPICPVFSPIYWTNLGGTSLVKLPGGVGYTQVHIPFHLNPMDRYSAIAFAYSLLSQILSIFVTDCVARIY